MGTCPSATNKFQNIARLGQKHFAAGKPVLSIDTKKKEREVILRTILGM